MPGKHEIGLAGEAAVMSEFAVRGYNVAMPAVDKGDDVFVVNHVTGAMWRIQVKTSLGSPRGTSTYYQFRVRETAIHPPTAPASHFVFVLRVDDRWRFVVIATNVLHNYTIGQQQQVGTPAGENRQFTFIRNKAGTVTCSSVSFDHHLEDWAVWPPLA